MGFNMETRGIRRRKVFNAVDAEDARRPQWNSTQRKKKFHRRR
jgi:hypothetical protein